MAKDDGNAVTWPGGWNILVEDTTNSYYLGVGWRRASSEPASYTWTFTAIWRDVVMMSYSGAVTGENPLDPDTPPGALPGLNSGNPHSWSTNDITTTTADTTAIAIHADVGISTWNAEPGGWTARQNASANELHVMDQAFATAQTVTGPTQAAQGNATAAHQAYILALQSVPTDKHYLLPPAFPGVFNLDARRMI